MKGSFNIKRLLLYWLLSYGIALPAYYLLYELMPNGYVFGMYFRMYLYHYQYPEMYIGIPCIFFGILATKWSDNFFRATFYGKLFWTAVVVGLTVLLGSPFGGMLWHFHDMQAGFFPENWLSIMIGKGSLTGLQFGWLIVALSFPYNVLGIIVSYFMLNVVSRLFRV